MKRVKRVKRVRENEEIEESDVDSYILNRIYCCHQATTQVGDRRTGVSQKQS